MHYIYPLIFGFFVSLLGFLAPSMLSMTAVRVSIEKEREAGLQFAAGAAMIIFLQSFLAVFFAKYLLANPQVIIILKETAIFILLGLSIFFAFQAHKELKIKEEHQTGNNYFSGIVMASLNQLAIPFYLVMATFGESSGWIKFNLVNSFFYMTGAAIGSFSIFSVYVIFAERISVRYQFIAKNINYILSGFFIIISIITSVQIFT